MAIFLEVVREYIPHYSSESDSISDGDLWTRATTLLLPLPQEPWWILLVAFASSVLLALEICFCKAVRVCVRSVKRHCSGLGPAFWRVLETRAKHPDRRLLLNATRPRIICPVRHPAQIHCFSIGANMSLNTELERNRSSPLSCVNPLFKARRRRKRQKVNFILIFYFIYVFYFHIFSN